MLQDLEPIAMYTERPAFVSSQCMAAFPELSQAIARDSLFFQSFAGHPDGFIAIAALESDAAYRMMRETMVSDPPPPGFAAIRTQVGGYTRDHVRVGDEPVRLPVPRVSDDPEVMPSKAVRDARPLPRGESHPPTPDGYIHVHVDPSAFGASDEAVGRDAEALESSRGMARREGHHGSRGHEESPAQLYLPVTRAVDLAVLTNAFSGDDFRHLFESLSAADRAAFWAHLGSSDILNHGHFPALRSATPGQYPLPLYAAGRVDTVTSEVSIGISRELAAALLQHLYHDLDAADIDGGSSAGRSGASMTMCQTLAQLYELGAHSSDELNDCITNWDGYNYMRILAISLGAAEFAALQQWFHEHHVANPGGPI
jgi:hypothetical protein